MTGTLVSTLAMWQGTDLSGNDLHWLMIFTGVAAFGLLLQSIIIIAAAIVGFKTLKEVLLFVNDFKAKAMPLIAKSEALIAQASAVTADLSPMVKEITAKINGVAANVEHLSTLVKDKAEEFGPTVTAANETVAQANETVREVNRKAQEQIVRVNAMVTSVLDSAAEMGHSIRRGISLPGREASGLISGVKAAFGTLMARPRSNHKTEARPMGGLITSYHSMGDVPNPRTPYVPDAGTATAGVGVDHIYATDKDLGL